MPISPTGNMNTENNVLQQNNPQNISNYMNALNNVGAGTNNAQLANSAPALQQMPQQQQLLNPYLGQNGNGGQYGYMPLQGLSQLGGNSAYVTQNPWATGGSVNYSPAYSPYQTQNRNQLTGQPGPLPQNGATQYFQNNGNPFQQPPQPQPNPATQQAAANYAAAQAQLQTPGGITSPFGGGGPYNSNNPIPVQYTQTPDPPFNQDAVNQGNMWKDALGIFAGTTLFSDETVKTNIQPGNEQVQDFLSKIGAWEYNYKDKQDGAGTYISPMAQELASTELGKSAVVTGPNGKLMVQYGRLGGINLAASALLNQRLNKLESLVQSKLKGK